MSTPRLWAAVSLVACLSLASLGAESAPLPSPPPPSAGKFEPRSLPALNDEGAPIRVVEGKNYRIELSLAEQKLAVDAPKQTIWREAETGIEPGDTVEVVAAETGLMSGRTPLATLRRGRRLHIHRVQGDWLATAAVSDGVRKVGWVPRRAVKFVDVEGELFPTLGHALEGSFASAAVLTQKGKVFDDGLYAAVELAAQEGAGKFAGKEGLLQSLCEALGGGSAEQPASVIFAAAQLSGAQPSAPPRLAAPVQQTVGDFLADPLRSKPIGFYTWSKELSAIFQQDRMLQSELKGPGIAELARSLHADPQARKTYERYLRLVSQLTNPLKKEDLRPLLAQLDAGELAAPEKGVYFFPPSVSHEAELVMKLYGDSPIPEGFDLMSELIARIRSGEVDLTPTEASGWYDRQTFALAPLVMPGKTPEAKNLQLSPEYEKLLVDLFKGALALARETHVKQLEIPAPAAEAPFEEPREIVTLQPELATEPLPTSYARRAAAYRFVRQALEEAFGAEALAQMRRQTAQGSVQAGLADELAEMEALFHGAAVAAGRQIGVLAEGDGPAGAGPDHEAAARRFLDWSAALAADPDLGQDVRMMVPVFYDQQRKRTKVWVFLGWQKQSLVIRWAAPPPARVFDKEGRLLAAEAGPDLHWIGKRETALYPVTAEVYVNRLLNREEFRLLCDTHQRPAAILASLE